LFPADELEECAVLAAALLLLIEQGQVVVIERIEPVVPVDVQGENCAADQRKIKDQAIFPG
jgi:hypothetical protein